jgi:hypothetical protein
VVSVKSKKIKIIYTNARKEEEREREKIKRENNN